MVSNAPDGSRTAFHLWPVHEHRGRPSSITAIALQQAAGKLLLGFSDGQLEEHRIIPPPASPTSTSATAAAAQDSVAPRLALAARKQVGKRPVTAIAACEAASRLAVLCDGLLMLLDADTLEGQLLPGIKGVTAIAADPMSGYPPRLALALKSGKRVVRIMLYELLGGAATSLPRGATAMCTGQVEITEPLSIKAMAWVGGSLLLCTSLRYAVLDPKSRACTHLFSLPADAPSPTLILPLHTSKLAILLMDQVGLVVDAAGHPASSALSFHATPAALASAGLYVITAGDEGLAVFERSTGECVQQLPYGEGIVAAPGQHILAADNAHGSCIAIAGNRKVWLLRSVAMEEQARQLLRSGAITAALHLAELCSGQGSSWGQTAFAEAGFLLIHGMRFSEATAALLHCNRTAFQPAELFLLFPLYSAPWAGRLPQQRHWGLHPPLPDLHALATRCGAGRDGYDVEGAVLGATRCCVDYLMQVRASKGVALLDGIDSLLVGLLTDLDAVPELESFVSGVTHVAVPLVTAGLQGRGHWHVMALLHAAKGNPEAALQIWQDIEQGRHPEAASSSGRSPQEASVAAVRCATELLGEGGRVEAPLAMHFLPWLIAAAPQDALAVLQGRALPESEVLVMLRSASKPALWRYLDHLVSGISPGTSSSTVSPQLHTELALVLLKEALRLAPELATTAASALPHRIEDGDGRGTAELDLVRRKLQSHLESSACYDVSLLLMRLAFTQLWQEQVILHAKVGDHLAALRLLALTMGDVRAAEAYCEAHVGEAGYEALMEMLLRPSPGRSPLFAEACHLLANTAADLDPLRVLEALPSDAPLGSCYATLAALLCERTHRRRHCAIVRNLRRADSLAASADRAEVLSQRVLIGEERACHLCHTRIGTKMFAVYPNGSLLCFRCFRNAEPHVDSIAGRDFLQHPRRTGEHWPD